MAKRIDVEWLKEPIEAKYKNVKVAIEPYRSREPRNRHQSVLRNRHRFVLEVLDAVEPVKYVEPAFEKHLPYFAWLEKSLTKEAEIWEFADELFKRAEGELIEKFQYTLEAEIKGMIKVILTEYIDLYTNHSR